MLSFKTLSALAALSSAALAAPQASSSAASPNVASFEDTEYNHVLAQACVDAHPTRQDIFNVWQDLNCVLAAVGTNVRSRPIDSFLLFNFGDKIDDVPLSADTDNPPSGVISQLAYGTDGPITAQSWVDAYYGGLSDLDSPYYPEDVSEITYFYDNVASWTGNCDGSVPNNEWSDYIKYSSTVNSGNSCQSNVAAKAVAGDIPAITTPPIGSEAVSTGV